MHERTYPVQLITYHTVVRRCLLEETCHFGDFRHRPHFRDRHRHAEGDSGSTYSHGHRFTRYRNSGHREQQVLRR